VRERKQFDAAIGTFGIMQAKIADMYTALQSSRAYAYQVARGLRPRGASRIDPASCLLHASQARCRVTLEAIQTLGGNGYINEYPTGRMLRDAKLYEIGAGTNEIRRMLIGRELFHGKNRGRSPRARSRAAMPLGNSAPGRPDFQIFVTRPTIPPPANAAGGNSPLQE
jgi:isovaleryl-CoA dehydrogenase